MLAGLLSYTGTQLVTIERARAEAKRQAEELGKELEITIDD